MDAFADQYGYNYSSDVSLCLSFEAYDIAADLNIFKQCQVFNGTCPESTNTTEETDGNVLSARKIGSSVGGAVAGVACVVGGSTGALMAYRRRHDLPPVDPDMQMDESWSTAHDNQVFSSEDLATMTSSIVYEAPAGENI